MAFKERTTSPAMDNKYYIHVSEGGYNRCIRISGNQCLPNCVGYAYGRFMEEAGKKSCNLPACNAEDWYAQAKANGYKVGSTPKVGAVIVCRKGKLRTSSDGCGHVAIVERVYSDGTILISQSGYGSSRFWTSKLSKPYKLSGYVLLGFIYNPDVADKVTKAPSYIEGKTYTLQTDLKVRAGAGTDKRWLKRKELTANAKKNAQAGTYAVLKAGTKVTCKAISGNWMKIPSSWICCKEGSSVYVK